jgi:alpha-tubulin suppressor-like RCC1 family protein
LGFTSHSREDNTNTLTIEKKNTFTVINPKTCSFNIVVRQVACGLNHSHLVTRDGFLYSMGSNEDGKLGLGQSPKDLAFSTSPRLVESLRGVKTVASGLNHSLAIGKDSKSSTVKVYGWGQAEYGAIGMRLQNSYDPQEI